MMQPWFSEAKLGIFIHWGIYAVKGIAASWSFYNHRISYEDYMKQLEGFTAANYDPREWAGLFKRAQARYAVLTSKHHDGVALWDSAYSDLNVVKKTPAARDLFTPYVEAMREAGLKVGIYFSHLDWSNPDYASVLPAGGIGEEERREHPWEFPQGDDDPQGWQRFLEFHRGQIQELCRHYGPDLLWFDGDWYRSNEQWDMKGLREQLHTWAPGVVLNSRMGKYGDYKTPEQGIPIVRPEGPWEFCVTMNDSWGFEPKDKNYKSLRMIIRLFAECIGMGGNMLLGIGPRQDGTIPEEEIELLEGLGRWIGKHEEAVFSTTEGLPQGHLYGTSTLSKSAEVLYPIIFDRPWDSVSIKGIRNKIKKISVLGSGRELIWKKVGGAPWLDIPGVLWIDINHSDLDVSATVLKIELEGTLDLYRGAGQGINKN